MPDKLRQKAICYFGCQTLMIKISYCKTKFGAELSIIFFLRNHNLINFCFEGFRHNTGWKKLLIPTYLCEYHLWKKSSENYCFFSDGKFIKSTDSVFVNLQLWINELTAWCKKKKLLKSGWDVLVCSPLNNSLKQICPGLHGNAQQTAPALQRSTFYRHAILTSKAHITVRQWQENPYVHLLVIQSNKHEKFSFSWHVKFAIFSIEKDVVLLKMLSIHVSTRQNWWKGPKYSFEHRAIIYSYRRSLFLKATILAVTSLLKR